MVRLSRGSVTQQTRSLSASIASTAPNAIYSVHKLKKALSHGRKHPDGRTGYCMNIFPEDLLLRKLLPIIDQPSFEVAFSLGIDFIPFLESGAFSFANRIAKHLKMHGTTRCVVSQLITSRNGDSSLDKIISRIEFVNISTAVFDDFEGRGAIWIRYPDILLFWVYDDFSGIFSNPGIIKQVGGCAIDDFYDNFSNLSHREIGKIGKYYQDLIVELTRARAKALSR